MGTVVMNWPPDVEQHGEQYIPGAGLHHQEGIDFCIAFALIGYVIKRYTKVLKYLVPLYILSNLFFNKGGLCPLRPPLKITMA